LQCPLHELQILGPSCRIYTPVGDPGVQYAVPEDIDFAESIGLNIYFAFEAIQVIPLRNPLENIYCSLHLGLN